MEVEILYIDGCPNHRGAVERVLEVLREEGISAAVSAVNVPDIEVARRTGFLGSPTVRVNGVDVEPAARSANESAMACRTYVVDGRREGLPSREMIRHAIRDARSAVAVQDSPQKEIR